MAADGLSVTPCSAVHDARKRADIKLTYIVDVEVTDEAAAIKRARRQAALRRDARHGVPLRHEGARARQFPAPGRDRHGAVRPVRGLIRADGFPPHHPRTRKAVRERTATPSARRKSVLNPESNVQFGEGGAGTFSDGKLYSQIKDPNHYGRRCWTNSSRPVRQTTSCI